MDGTIEPATRQPDRHADRAVLTGDRTHTFSGPVPIYDQGDYWCVLVHDGLQYADQGDALSAWNGDSVVRRGRVAHYAVDESETFTYLRAHPDLL